jgi:hypothetical protein
VKGASSKKSICSELSEAHFDRMAKPFIGLVQERISGPDIRVHLTRSGYVAEAFVSLDVDYRFSKRNSTFKVHLPPHVLAFCYSILEAESVCFAGIDFKLDFEGQWWFLEANASPAFQGFDIRTGGGIVSLLMSWDADITKRNPIGSDSLARK